MHVHIRNKNTHELRCQSDFTDLNDFNSTDDDGDTTNGDQHYKSVLHV